MTQQEAKEYMIKQVNHMLHDWKHNINTRDIRMQVTGMMKAFRAAGIIKDGWQDILNEVLDMI